MKILNLKTAPTLSTTQKLLKEILKKDASAIKAISMQFIRNNQAYNSRFIGFIA